MIPKFRISKIDEYLLHQDFESFNKDYKTQDAIIRNIELIGEASNRLSNDFATNHKEFPLQKVISMRNRLIHGYEDIDLEIVWITAAQDLKKLESIINSILPLKLGL